MKAVVVSMQVPEYFVMQCRLRTRTISMVKIRELFQEYIEEMIREDTTRFFLSKRLGDLYEQETG